MFLTVSLYRGSLMLPRNFFTTYLNAFHASSISVIVSVKLSSIISLQICGPSNIPSLILACDNEINLVHKYWKHGLFLSNALTNCFIIPSLMRKGESRIFFTVNKTYIRDIFGSWLQLLPFGPMYSFPLFVPGPAVPLA